ncbi:MAG: response regulator [Planctomycetota bacterium]|nr:response regulator [Planctomycetota bacterium]MDA1139024.1 response regulator [Planctomycetota bacterium]
MSVKKVFIVDKDPEVTRSLKSLFDQDGHQSRVANSAFEAEDLMRMDTPDLLVLDVYMPIWSGIDFCRKIRNDGSNCPVLFLSTENSPELRKQALEAEADGFISKPFDPDQLLMRAKLLMEHGLLEPAGQG